VADLARYQLGRSPRGNSFDRCHAGTTGAPQLQAASTPHYQSPIVSKVENGAICPLGTTESIMYGIGGRPEYSVLAKLGDKVWAKVIDPILLVVLGKDEVTSLLRIRAGIQITVLVAVILIPVSFFWRPAHVLTASGLLFDIAGIVRLFLLEEINEALKGYTPNEHDNYPSVAMREFIMPEGVFDDKVNANPTSFFYYKRRGIFFLFLGFVLQMIADWV
jgi:hypothetical protein